MDDLKRVLEDVLPVARAEAETAEDDGELFGERAAVRLEHRLLAGLADELLHLGFRLVVRLLDPRWMDPAVLDELRQREPRDLAPEAVEGRENDRMRCVVDDEVNAGQVLERADVPALAADDPALNVVRRELDHGYGRLGSVTRGNALQRVGDEVACPAAGLRPRFVLEHPHTPGQLVARLRLPPLDEVRPGVCLRHPGDSLELRDPRGPCVLELVLECPEVRLPVGEPLMSPVELGELLLDLELLRQHAPLDLQDLCAPVGELRVDLTAQRDGLLPAVDLRFAANSFRLPAGVLEEPLPDPARLAHARRPEDGDRQQRKSDPCRDPDGDSDPDLHWGSSVCGPTARRRRVPAAPGLLDGSPGTRSPTGVSLREVRALPRGSPPCSRVGVVSHVRCGSEKLRLQAKRQDGTLSRS